MSPVTIPNPSTMLSYQKAVDAGLVDESFKKVIAKKAEQYGGNIGWCADAEFSRASAEVISGIGPKYAEALGAMSVFNFATTKGGMGFAGLEPIIGKEGVTRLRKLQAALKACMLVEQPEPQPGPMKADRFAEMFAKDFNGYDVSEMVGPTLVELLNNGIGGNHKEVVEQYASLIAFELLGASLNAYDQMADYVGMSVEDIGYMVQNAYHGALGPLSDDDKMRVGKRAEALMNQYAVYLPEDLQKALGLEPTGPAPAEPAQMTAAEFMAEFMNDFNGRNMESITIEDAFLKLEEAADPAARQAVLGDIVSFLSFGMLQGAMGMHEGGMAAVEIAAGVSEPLEKMTSSELCKTEEEKAFVAGELAKIGDVYLSYLPEVLASALSSVWPA